MYSWRNFMDKYRRQWRFKPSEVRGLIITLVVIAFIFSFREWGTTTFDWNLGFANFGRSLLLVGLALLAHEFGHRTVATWLGYVSEYKAWILGLIAGLVVAFVSNGYLLFLAPGMVLVNYSMVHRLGTYPHGPNLKHVGWIAMSGAIANVVLAIICKALYFSFPNPWLLKAVNVNIWLALFNMIPLPPFDGVKMFFGSKLVYVFVLGSMIGAAVLLFWSASILSVLGSMLIGFILLAVFFIFVDRNKKVFG